MKRRTTTDVHARMTAKQLARATAEFENEFVADSFETLSPQKQVQFERARRKPGRPRLGAGAKVISVSVERELLDRADSLARELGLTRARLVARGLKAVLAAQGRG